MFLLFKDSGDYKLTFAMTVVTQCSLLYLRGRNGFLDKKNDKLTCTGKLKLSTTILLWVEVGPLVCLRELNRSEMFLVLLVPYFNLYLSAMFEFCWIYVRLKIKK